ncbi:basic proline-rich protein-like [Neopelma chrysocephalum]|uniref:basic proline-rich protein-like n=1 Tax=Neopelma chrysocephalum TaxID=114329 RepID=UPI000FCD00D9|nr:basic proline-rich protein-like [Neopelma chrysocephalum]
MAAKGCRIGVQSCRSGVRRCRAGVQGWGSGIQGAPTHPPPYFSVALQDPRLPRQRIPHPRGPLSAPGRPSGRMFPPPGCRRGFPREPGPWGDGAGPCPPPGPEDAWDEPPWEQRRRRGWGGWNRETSVPHFPSSASCSQDTLGFTSSWCLILGCLIQAALSFPQHHQQRDALLHRCGPDGIPWNEEEEDRMWAPHNYPLPPWDGRGDMRGPEEDFTQDWFPELQPGPCPEPLLEEEQPPPWHPAGPPGRRGGGRGGGPPWDCGPPWNCDPPWDCDPPRGRRGRRLRRSRRELTLVPCGWGPRPPRGHKPPSRASPSCPKPSQPATRKELQPPDPPQPPVSPQGPVERPEQTQDLPEGSGEVPKTPEPSRTPPRSPDTDPCAAGPEQESPGTPVEPGAEQTPLGSQEQDPCALGAEPVPLEENSAVAGEQLEVEPGSPAAPEAGTGDGSHPHSPAAPLDPAGREHPAPSCSAEVGAELSPRSRGEQCLPSGAGEAEAEAAHDGGGLSSVACPPPQLLESLQPPENSQVPPEPAAEADAQPSQACPDPCTSPKTSPGPQHPPGSSETNPAGDGEQQLCFRLPTPSPSRRDLRSAAVLARKEAIELSYQQFSLNIAVVATMLLQKEPSMEETLGLALRANLRQGRIHHLRELEDFINSYDSATPSP